MKKFSIIIALLLSIASCTNTPELESGEIKTLQVLKDAIDQKAKPRAIIDAKDVLSRKQIDKYALPVLFVELPTGQNGTLTLYPGKGIGQTWLGTDGATITLNRGILKSSRGMGDDLMGSKSFMPEWDNFKEFSNNYERQLKYLSGNNKIISKNLTCKIRKVSGKESLEIWDLDFIVEKFEESCNTSEIVVKNIYYLDSKKIVRKSLQYHSKKIGYLRIERLDR